MSQAGGTCPGHRLLVIVGDLDPPTSAGACGVSTDVPHSTHR